jgi:hypothetical protein
MNSLLSLSPGECIPFTFQADNGYSKKTLNELFVPVKTSGKKKSKAAEVSVVIGLAIPGSKNCWIGLNAPSSCLISGIGGFGDKGIGRIYIGSNKSHHKSGEEFYCKTIQNVVKHYGGVYQGPVDPLAVRVILRQRQPREGNTLYLEAKFIKRCCLDFEVEHQHDYSQIVPIKK